MTQRLCYRCEAKAPALRARGATSKVRKALLYGRPVSMNLRWAYGPSKAVSSNRSSFLPRQQPEPLPTEIEFNTGRNKPTRPHRVASGTFECEPVAELCASPVEMTPRDATFEHQGEWAPAPVPKTPQLNGAFKFSGDFSPYRWSVSSGHTVSVPNLHDGQNTHQQRYQCSKSQETISEEARLSSSAADESLFVAVSKMRTASPCESRSSSNSTHKAGTAIRSPVKKTTRASWLMYRDTSSPSRSRHNRASSRLTIRGRTEG